MNKKFFMDNLQLEESEYALIRDPQRGSCLYKCGNERYLLQVQAPEYKQAISGTAGGRYGSTRRGSGEAHRCRALG